MRGNVGTASGCSGVLGMEHNLQGGGHHNTVSATYEIGAKVKEKRIKY